MIFLLFVFLSFSLYTQGFKSKLNMLYNKDSNNNVLHANKKERIINIGFLCGSNTGYEFYTPFINNLYNKINNNTNIYNYNVNIKKVSYFPLTSFENNTILIGHSFGGTMSLLYAIRDTLKNENNILSCIIINSHYNLRNKMPYPSISPILIKQPVLTILNRQDKRIPFIKAIDDYNIILASNISDKKFEVNNGTHFSCFINENEINITVNQIIDFLTNYEMV